MATVSTFRKGVLFSNLVFSNIITACPDIAVDYKIDTLCQIMPYM